MLVLTLTTKQKIRVLTSKEKTRHSRVMLVLASKQKTRQSRAQPRSAG